MGLEIVNELKRKKGLTSEQLSKESGVPLGTLNKILNGTTKDPKLETLKALARVLECSLDDFDDSPKKKEINQLETLASHFEGEEFTKDDLDDIENFIKYVKSKKKK
ncbi:helix-turn-helix transcriptional regulator [Clostridium pasteurianum]|uniref:helix-turn-helix domain-containing protein n=1 Tax=Clostridium pasteurianum TaxID=1501 RepID=UPI002260CA10|nr:helix-turn-helix transcriptional regulator [Clostridium pasteurianum]UZW13235.1 helix-turn-helix transcriptional regulator [Clostridium pasteurianum]